MRAAGSRVPARRRFFRAAALLALFAAGTSGRGLAATVPDGSILRSAVIQLADSTVRRLEASSPGLREQLRQVETRAITYLSDGLEVRGYLVAPRKGENLPCVIFNRGGNLEFGAWTDVSATVSLGRIAAWGYVVVASQYRGNAGGEGREEFGGSDVNDVLHLVPLLESVPRADAQRIGMYGWSRGGMMTYLALARTNRVSAAIVGGGLSDLAMTAADRPEMESEVFAPLIPGYDYNREAEQTVRSAIRWPEKLPERTPLLMLHGTADWRVSPRQPLALAARLLELKRPFRLVMLEGGDHGLREHRAEVDRLAREWLDRYVRDRTPWPNLEPHGP